MVYIALLMSVVLVAADQLTKYLVVTYVEPVGSVNLIQIGDKQILNFTYCENTGAAFSILEGQRWFLCVAVALVVGAALFLLLSKRVTKPTHVWGAALVIAGGAGNLIDRVLLGYVVDFIDFRFIHFAIFNVADICAVCGTLFLAAVLLIEEIKEIKKTNDDKKTHTDG
ncbi:MAG: signal peptidase II [Oscillospiraceae bacterium]|jgi:signal peptidase II|nr:signal peptidase II [Oscillospiraceae bacterium]